MRSHQSLLLLSVAIFFVFATGPKTYSYKGMGNTHASSGYNIPEGFYFQKDTTPKKKAAELDVLKEANIEAAKKIADSKLKELDFPLPKKVPEKKKIFEKILALFQFRKKSQKKEEDRIAKVIDQLQIKDTIVNRTAALQKEITSLINDLSDKEKADFDTLLSAIEKLRSDTSYRNEFRDFINNVTERLNGDTSKSPPPFISGSFVTDKDILDATGNFVPLLEQKKNEAAKEKIKRETLAKLSLIARRNSDTCHVMAEDKKSFKIYKLNTRTKAEVIGFHNYTLNNNGIDEYKYNYLNTLIYQSLFVNEKTGDFKSRNGWDTAEVINQAKAKNLKIMFTVSVSNPEAIADILAERKIQSRLISNIISAIKFKKADGVNIQFANLRPSEKNDFTDFIENLHRNLQETNPTYQLLITVPAYNKEGAYDIKSLDNFADRFLIDFTSTPATSGALAPLGGPGEFTMQNSVAYYTSAMEVPVNKIITILPYYGIRWQVKNKKLSTQLSLMPYHEIRNTYKNNTVYYDTESGNAVIDALENKYRTVRVVYDDQNSLEKKYDYVLESGLRGIAVNALGYDSSYGELWDALAYKFTTIDSVFQRDSIIASSIKPFLTWREKAIRKLALYWYIVNNPCKVCFSDSDTSRKGYSDTLNLYLQELKIDSLIIAKNKLLPINERYKSRFEYVNYELTQLLVLISILFFILLVLAAVFYVYQIKVKSAEWKWKSKMELVLIAITILFVGALFSYLFCDDTIPFFGSSHAVDLKGQHNEVNQTFIGANAVPASVCDTHESGDCINMPLYTLMGIIVAGMVVGFLITRYLILPLTMTKRRDIP